MNQVRSLLSLLILAAILWGIFTGARRTATLSRRARRGVLAGATVGIVAAVAAILLLPRLVPDTPGSPAALVFITLIWLVGGVGLLMAVPALFGAFVAKPPEGP